AVGPARVPPRGSVPEPGERRVHALHDAVEPLAARRRPARVPHDDSPPRRREGVVRRGIRVRVGGPGVLIDEMLILLAALLQAALPEPLAPEKTVDALRVPAGFSVKLFAGEPDVQQPVSFCIDDRGRLWVAENRSYPKWTPEGKDRIVILEDSDGDGRFDRRTVFCEGLTMITGIEVGFGNQGGHNIVNGFTWGPDGWLYAGHGRTSLSDLGKPGTPPEKRVHFDGGVWRYHPTRHVFEAWCDGTTNPWGVAFDDRGQAIITTCVDVHLYHAIQGAHFEPWR